MRYSLILAVLVVLPVTVLAEHGDQTILYYMSHSTLVVSGTMPSQPVGKTGEAGVVRYSFDIQITEVLHGHRPKEDTIRVQMTRVEMGTEDALPFLKKGAKCILFLTVYATTGVTDPWFGVQPYNSHMANRIKELSKQKRK